MNLLENRTLFIPDMDYAGANVLAASFRSTGIKAQTVPPSNDFTLRLGGKVTSGDECYPQKITVGDFLGILERGVVKPENAAFFMPVAEGPCRFGQYATLIRQILEKEGYGDAVVFSITSQDGYQGVGEHSKGIERTIWRGIVGADVLRKYLLRTRPYEKHKGEADRVFKNSVANLCSALEKRYQNSKLQLEEIISSLINSANKFRAIDVEYKDYPLIGVVGEIFCRLNEFSNSHTIRRLEALGAEAWLAGVGEWVIYTNLDRQRKLKDHGKAFSLEMLISKLKVSVMLKDEHRIAENFKDLFHARREEDVRKLLTLSRPYLPQSGALGEMTLSTANILHYQNEGADGVIDISPFTCMNGIISEAVYPKLSKQLGGFPIRVLYFDGTQSNLERDLGIFLELAKNYRKKKLGV